MLLLRTFCASRSLQGRSTASTHAFTRCWSSSSPHPSCVLRFRIAYQPQFRALAAVRHISTSSCRKAPWLPIAAIIGRKALQVVAMIVGRFIRVWYKSLPKNKRIALQAWYHRNRRAVLAATASLLICIGLYYVAHIERTPITGRIRFITVTHAQLERLSEFELEQHMALHSDHLLPDNDRRVVVLRHVLAKLIRGNGDIPGLSEHKWKVFVVDEPTVCNAFVMPTGHIFFFTGMLDTVENEEQLGVVLSHEMAHTVLGHGLENMSYTRMLDWLKIVIFAAIWTIVPNDGSAIFFSWFCKFFHDAALHLPFSRKLEIEADAVGLQMAAKACFDVRESYAYWIGMQMDDVTNDKLAMPGILSTHPDHGDRAERLKALMDAAVALRAQCNCPPINMRRDPIKLADSKKFLLNQQLALEGKI